MRTDKRTNNWLQKRAFALAVFMLIFLLLALSAFAEDLNTSVPDKPVCRATLGRVNPFESVGLQLNFPPETGSIEDLYPGTIEGLMQLRINLVNLNKLLKTSKITIESSIARVQQELIQPLTELQSNHPDKRFGKIINIYVEKMRGILKEDLTTKSSVNLSYLNHVLSFQWEVIVACLFEGEIIRLGKSVRQLHRTQFDDVFSDYDITTYLDREIDIAVFNHGQWRWIEVKNWSTQSMENDVNNEEGFLEQSDWQVDIARSLELPIKVLSVFKFGPPSPEVAEYLGRSNVDQILFMFP